MNVTRNRFALAQRGLAFLILLIAVSCTSPTFHQPQSNMGPILYVGTPAYEAKVKRLKYDSAMARQLLTDFLRGRPGSPPEPAIVATGSHSVIVGDWYLFHNKEKTGEIPFTGYYVHGNAGRVEYRVNNGTVPKPRARATDSDTRIVWQGTRAYERLVTSLPIQPAEAFRLAVQESKKTKGRIAASQPEFLVGNWSRLSPSRFTRPSANFPTKFATKFGSDAGRPLAPVCWPGPPVNCGLERSVSCAG